MGCIICKNLKVREHPFIQWYCNKNNKIVEDIYSFPDWCPSEDVLYDD